MKIAGSNSIAGTGSFIIVPGFNSQTIYVAAIGEVTSAASKTFTLNLSNVTNATNTSASGIGTIYYILMITPGAVS